MFVHFSHFCTSRSRILAVSLTGGGGGMLNLTLIHPSQTATCLPCTGASQFMGQSKESLHKDKKISVGTKRLQLSSAHLCLILVMLCTVVATVSNQSMLNNFQLSDKVNMYMLRNFAWIGFFYSTT